MTLADGALEPMLLVALTVQLYAMPLVSPTTSTGLIGLELVFVSADDVHAAA